MIVLLPLRGWAGGLMGVQMATSGSVQHVAADMPEDCPMLIAADASDEDANGRADAAGKGCCASCELCTPVAELPHSAVDLVAMAGDAQAVIGGVAFVSAPRALNFKPPIF